MINEKILVGIINFILKINFVKLNFEDKVLFVLVFFMFRVYVIEGIKSVSE